MNRVLLFVFVGGLLIAIACFAGVRALGGNGDLSLRDLPGMAGESLDFDPRDKTTRKIALGEVNALEIDIPADIEFTQGEAAEVTIKGVRRIIDDIQVENGRIFADKSSLRRMRDNSVTLTIVAPKVETFRLNGAQSMTIHDYDQPSLTLEANGASAVEAKGSADKITLRLNGASHADLGDMINDEATVEVNGASNASVSPKTSVDIRINGVGNVSLGSRPARINKEVHGIGGVSYETGDKEEKADDAAPPPPAPATKAAAA